MGTISESFGMWLASSVMVIVVVVQSILYFRLGRSEAKKLNIPDDKVKAGIRAAGMTAIGPALAAVIVLLSLVVMVGAPTAWMRLNDIGAARTEMAVVSMTESILPEGASEEMGFVFANWGMAFNNVGWMIVALFAATGMGKAVEKMNTKYNPLLVKAVMGGAAFGLFAYLVSNATVGKPSASWIAAGASAVAILIINKLLGKYRTLQELSLGIAMIIGMIFGSIFTV